MTITKLSARIIGSNRLAALLSSKQSLTCMLIAGLHLAYGPALLGQDGDSGAVSTTVTEDVPNSLDFQEEQAFLNAGNFAQSSVVQIEIFGAYDPTNSQNVAPGAFSGTVLTEDGWIATSNHFFQTQPASITVILPSGERKAAKLVARDRSREIAILKIDVEQPLQTAKASDSATWQVGQWTIALGKSFDALIASRSVGILSAVDRVWNKAIQTDCKISPQNYGGPLIDLYGNCMGVLTTLNPGIVTEGEVEQWYDSGIGFAIPLSDIQERLPILQTGKDINAGQAGFAIRGKDEFLPGLVIGGVTPGSPAFKSDLKAGDEIIRAGSDAKNLTKVTTYTNLKHVMGPIDAGKTLFIERQRDGQLSQIEMVLVDELPKYQEPYLGVVLFKLDDHSEKILQIAEGSPASKAGLKIGDRILKVGDEPLDQELSLKSLLPFRDFREPLTLTIAGESGVESTVKIDLIARPNDDVRMGPVLIPQKLTSQNANNTESEQSGAPKGIIQIPLGDVKNKSFAIVPSEYSKEISHGLLVIYAEAGEHDSKIWNELWEKFCSENRWICAVIQSSDEARWTFEEVEVGQRVRAYLGSNYTIDDQRTCVAGFGSGGVMALVTSAQFENDFQALWLADAKIPNRLRLTQASPEDNRRCFLNGSDKGVEKLAKLFEEAGYNFNFTPEDLGSFLKPDSAKIQDKPVLDRAKRWLRHLEAI